MAGKNAGEYIKLLDQAVEWFILDWQYTPTPAGEFAKKIMRGEMQP